MRKHKSDRLIGALTVALLAIGLVVIYAIGPMRVNVLNSTYGTDYSENHFFIRQLINVLISLAVFIIAFRFPYETIRKFAKPLMILGLVACASLALAAAFGSGIARCELGACRWFNLGSLSFQPAEILKIGLVLYLAELMARRKTEGKLENLSEFWVPFIIIAGLSLLFVVVIQKDLGTGVSLMAIILAMLFMSGVKLSYFIAVGAVVLVAGVGSIVVSPHRMERLLTFSNEDGSDSYHVENAMIAIGTGGLFGVGIGNSIQATGYLPESINDSVFAVMGETFGFVGLMTIMGIFALLLLRILRAAHFSPDDEHMLVLTGIFAWMAAHVFVNVASMTNLIPLTGITLPLLSYGGTSMIFTSAALGLALQLTCYTGREARQESQPISNSAKPRRRIA